MELDSGDGSWSPVCTHPRLEGLPPSHRAQEVRTSVCQLPPECGERSRMALQQKPGRTAADTRKSAGKLFKPDGVSRGLWWWRWGRTTQGSGPQAYREPAPPCSGGLQAKVQTLLLSGFPWTLGRLWSDMVVGSWEQDSPFVELGEQRENPAFGREVNFLLSQPRKEGKGEGNSRSRDGEQRYRRCSVFQIE